VAQSGRVGSGQPTSAARSIGGQNRPTTRTPCSSIILAAGGCRLTVFLTTEGRTGQGVGGA
jgi:hypothetical protein